MSLYATTAVPSYDLLGGVETLQRLFNEPTAVAHAIYDEESHSTIAILKTEGSELSLERIAEILEQFQVPLIKCTNLIEAINKAKKMAHDLDLVEVLDYKLEDSNSL